MVNLAFSSRFDTYLEQQRSARTEQMAAAVSAVYQAAGRWDADRLDQLAPAVAMAGADVRLLDPAGELLWPAEGSDPTGMAQMHRTMMETGPLTDPVSVPLTIDGQLRGTLQVALPVGSVPVADQQLRASVNQMLLAGGLAVALAASVFGMVLARRVTRPVAELTAAARDLRGGNRSRRAAVTAMRRPFVGTCRDSGLNGPRTRLPQRAKMQVSELTWSRLSESNRRPSHYE